MLSKHVTFVSFQSFCWKEELYSRKIRVHEVNVWIRANSYMNSCDFSICCSQYHSLSKKSKSSWNGWVLVENELSVWDPCVDGFWSFGCSDLALQRQPSVFWDSGMGMGRTKISPQVSHTESSFSTKTQPFQLILDFLNREWYWLQHIE
jgi:hypothetical protein